MYSGILRSLLVLASCMSFAAWGQSNGGDFSNVTEPTTKVPAGVILVKGAWASASDSATPLPEGGSIANQIYTSEYFGLSYPLPAGWFQKFQGPPPSDSGSYVLAQIVPVD